MTQAEEIFLDLDKRESSDGKAIRGEVWIVALRFSVASSRPSRPPANPLRDAKYFPASGRRPRGSFASCDWFYR